MQSFAGSVIVEESVGSSLRPRCVWCGGLSDRWTQSTLRPKLHLNCASCAELEIQTAEKGEKSFKVGSNVRRDKVGAKDYVVSNLSPKAIRLIARYAAILKMGGRLTDTPDDFYARYTQAWGCSSIEAERVFGLQTDKIEEQVRDEDGFLGTIPQVVDFVHQKLPEGFYLTQEVTGDHRINGGTVRLKAPAPSSSPSSSKKEIEKLVKQLSATTDAAERRQLRRRLRRLGHRGGAKGR